MFRQLLHLNQAGGAGLDRMVSLKGGLRRVVIQQLRLLGIVGLLVVFPEKHRPNICLWINHCVSCFLIVDGTMGAMVVV